MLEITPAQIEILRAVLAVIRRSGVGSLSMDAVAREAGLSKGGLFHHFSSKSEMLSALIQWIPQRAFTLIMERAGKDKRPIPLVRAMITVAFSSIPPIPEDVTQEELEVLSCVSEDSLFGLLAAAISSPDATEPFRDNFKLLVSALQSQPYGEQQMQLWLSAEGLLFWRLLGILRSDDPMFIEIVHGLRRSVDRLTQEILHDSGVDHDAFKLP